MDIDWDKFNDTIRNGGKMEFLIRWDELFDNENMKKEFQEKKKAFELPPTQLCEDESFLNHVRVAGSNFTRIVTETYHRKGRILYSKKDDEYITALVEVPTS